MLSGSFVRQYANLPLRDLLLRRIVAREGGEMTSPTLRLILKQYFGVSVGLYSYGSLLIPGRADRFTHIGRYVSIGPDVRRIGAAHPIDDISLHPYWYNSVFGYVDEASDVSRSGCVIGHDSWVGASAIILPGCRRIGIGAVVGAGSVVNHDVPDFAVVVGSPARVRRYRFSSELRESILDSNYWEFEPASARKRLDLLRAGSRPASSPGGE